MATTLKIKITKEILEKSKNCGRCAIRSCAIALAVRDIFPDALVAGSFIRPYSNEDDKIILPYFVTHYIAKFDSADAIERPFLPPIEFEISIPDEVVEKINIEEILPLLENHPNLKFTKRDINKVTQ